PEKAAAAEASGRECGGCASSCRFAAFVIIAQGLPAHNAKGRRWIAPLGCTCRFCGRRAWVAAPGAGAYAESMRETLRYGRAQLHGGLQAAKLIGSRTAQPIHPLPDLGAAVRAAVETPIGFPPLRRALTPDDHVTILVDESSPRLVELLVPILEHIAEAHV